MTALFIFGTLRHLPLFEAVIGDVSHLTFSPAAVPGFCVFAAQEGPFPTIRPKKTSAAEGMLVTGLTAHDFACLDYYEGAFGYQLAPVTTAAGDTAQAYMPPDAQAATDTPWDLDGWVAVWGALSVLAAREVMSYKGTKPAKDIAQMFGMIRARAWSRLNAQNSRHGAGTLDGAVEISAHRRVYANYFALDEIELRHARFDGAMTPTVLRAVFHAPDATLVLPYDPVRDRVLLVEQMRMGPLARGDKALWQLEPIAGRLDPGEAPEAAARREAQEEAGLQLGTMEAVAETYCSPGNSTEFYYIYVGAADLPDDAAGLGGLESEDEDIRSHVFTLDDLLAMCDRQEIANAPLVMATYWLARHRASLCADPEFKRPV
ncbi:MAG: NUDIX domain-containing protein [Roseobacter sp.]